MFNLPNPLALGSMLTKLKDIPDRMQQVNNQMKSERISGSSSCGHVTVTMNGIGEVQSVKMDPKTVSGDIDAAVVSAAVLEATNSAGAAAKQCYANAVADAARQMDIQIPGMDGLLASLSGRS